MQWFCVSKVSYEWESATENSKFLLVLQVHAEEMIVPFFFLIWTDFFGGTVKDFFAALDDALAIFMRGSSSEHSSVFKSKTVKHFKAIHSRHKQLENGWWTWYCSYLLSCYLCRSIWLTCPRLFWQFSSQFSTLSKARRPMSHLKLQQKIETQNMLWHLAFRAHCWQSVSLICRPHHFCLLCCLFRISCWRLHCARFHATVSLHCVASSGASREVRRHRSWSCHYLISQRHAGMNNSKYTSH